MNTNFLRYLVNNPTNDDQLAYGDYGKSIQWENECEEVGILCCAVNWWEIRDDVASIFGKKCAQYTEHWCKHSCGYFEEDYFNKSSTFLNVVWKWYTSYTYKLDNVKVTKAIQLYVYLYTLTSLIATSPSFSKLKCTIIYGSNHCLFSSCLLIVMFRMFKNTGLTQVACMSN